jgi:hypothetical protein
MMNLKVTGLDRTLVAAFCNATGKRVRDLPLSSNPAFG